MLTLKLSESTAARRRIPFYMVSDADGKTPSTGLSFVAGDIKTSKNGAGEQNHGGSVTEVAGGLYYYEATQGELDTVGYLSIRFTNAAVRTFVAVVQVVSVDLYDAVHFGISALPNAAAEAAGGLYTRGVGAGQINQDAAGRVDTRTVTMSAGAVTAAAIDTDAIDADALAADAVAEIQAGLATAAAVAGVQADTDDIQTRLPAALVGGRIDASVGAMDAEVIGASQIATDAIDADAIAADAIAEIQGGLATGAAVAAVQADTDDIQTRLPATLSGGRMRSQVEGLDAGVITASAVALDAVQEVVDGVWDEPIAGHLAAGSTGAKLNSGGGGGGGGTQTQWNVSYDEPAMRLYMEVWLERAGNPVQAADLVSTLVQIYDKNGTLVLTATQADAAPTAGSPQANGRWNLEKTLVLETDRPYNATVAVTDTTGTVTTFQAFTFVRLATAG